MAQFGGAIAYSTGYEVGWLAMGVGALCGAGMMAGIDSEDAGLISGIIAVVIALASIAGGKFAAIHFIVGKEVDEVRAEILQMPLEDGKVFLADQLVEEYEKAGRTLTWPEGSDVETAFEPEDYPADLWQDVEARWVTMTPEHQEEYRQAQIDMAMTGMTVAHGVADAAVFIESFHILDIVWAALATLTAFRLGSGTMDSE